MRPVVYMSMWSCCRHMQKWAQSMGMVIMANRNIYTVSDDYRPCHLILSILKPVFCQIQQICFTYNSSGAKQGVIRGGAMCPLKVVLPLR